MRTNTHPYTAKGAIKHPVIGSEVRASVPSPVAPNPGRQAGVWRGWKAGLGEGVGRGRSRASVYVLCVAGLRVTEYVCV